MQYLLYATLVPVSLAFNLLVIVTCWLWAAIAVAFNLTVLPWPLSWVHTHDNDIYGSGGDRGPIPDKAFDRFKRACWWLCRNPGYGFDGYVLGFDGSRIVDQTLETGDTWRMDQMTLTNGAKRFSYRNDFPLFDGRYIKIWFGWHYRDQAGRRMLKFDFNPFKNGEG